MTRKATSEWATLLSKIQGAWPGKVLRFAADSKEHAEHLRTTAFNVCSTVKHKPKIHTEVHEIRCDLYQVTIEVLEKRK